MEQKPAESGKQKMAGKNKEQVLSHMISLPLFLFLDFFCVMTNLQYLCCCSYLLKPMKTIINAGEGKLFSI